MAKKSLYAKFKRPVSYVALACCLHLLVLLILYKKSAAPISKPKSPMQVMPLTQVPAHQHAKLPPELRPKKLSGQVVEHSASDNQTAPQKADYLAEKNHTALQETRKKSNKPQQTQQANQDTKPQHTAPSPTINTTPKVFLGGAKLSTAEPLTMTHLIPQLGTLARIDNGTNDYLKDIQDGDSTYLNTKEFKYATFFNRVKHAISIYWHPLDVLNQQNAQSQGPQAWQTVITVTLRTDGSIEHLQISQSSHLDFLDQEALGAIKKAAPFLNPPVGLENAQGYIEFPFGFHVEMNRH